MNQQTPRDTNGQHRELADEIILSAIGQSASDIHIEPREKQLIVRLRVDGILYEASRHDLMLHAALVSRLKIMANLDIAEHRRPQEGHILFTLGEGIKRQHINVRLSIFPSILGEVAVMRILNRADLLFESLEGLSLSPVDLEKLKETILKPNGMILITGPTGSGKTTTIYTILNQLLTSQRSILTLEDPVEYQIAGIRQSQINPDIGFDFASGLRSILRQDPDIVMVGEIRDKETADIAMTAALLGRLFFSTLHTKDSVGALIRLSEFGISPSVISNTLLLIISQRLVRKVCQSCQTADRPTEKTMKIAEIENQDISNLRRGQGCPTCRRTGFSGRIGIYEFLNINDAIQDLIISNAPWSKIKEQVIKNGMRTLKQEAVRLALEGVITLEEALHTTPV